MLNVALERRKLWSRLSISIELVEIERLRDQPEIPSCLCQEPGSLSAFEEIFYLKASGAAKALRLTGVLNLHLCRLLVSQIQQINTNRQKCYSTTH